MLSETRKFTSKIRLSDFFLRSDIVQRGDNYDSFTRGLLGQTAQEQDQYFTPEVYGDWLYFFVFSENRFYCISHKYGTLVAGKY